MAAMDNPLEFFGSKLSESVLPEEEERRLDEARKISRKRRLLNKLIIILPIMVIAFILLFLALRPF